MEFAQKTSLKKDQATVVAKASTEAGNYYHLPTDFRDDWFLLEYSHIKAWPTLLIKKN